MPHPIDCHVGARLRQARLAQGLSQDALAQQLDLSFQQVQKYESGANRISASKLWLIAGIVGQPVEWFFADLPAGDETTPPEQPVRRRPSRSGFVLLQTYETLSPIHRDAVAKLARTLAGEKAASGEQAA